MAKDGKTVKNRGRLRKPQVALCVRGMKRPWVKADTRLKFTHTKVGEVSVSVFIATQKLMVRCGQEIGIMAFPGAVLCVSGYIVLIVREVDEVNGRVRLSSCNSCLPVPPLEVVA